MKKKTIITSFILASSIVIGGISVFHLLPSNEMTETHALEGEFVSNKPLPESYAINSEFYVPAGKIIFEGNSYSYNDYFLTYPDGRSYKKEAYTLDMTGSYSCAFIYKDSTKTLYSYYDFDVYNNAYTITSESSYVEYKEDVPTTKDTDEGLTITLTDGDMFTYNKLIDLSNSNLDEPVITYHPWAHTIRANPANKDLDLNQMFDGTDPNKPKPYAIDANRSVVRLTDAYDSTNYVEFTVFYRTANMSNNRQQQYCVGGWSGQSLTGLEVSSTIKSGNRLVTLEGTSYTVHNGTNTSRFGAPLNTRTGEIYETMNGVRHPITTTNDPSTTADLSNADDYGYSVFYDVATNKLYVKHINTYLVNDLDEPILHGDNVFKGFTTGEVFVSIYGAEYVDQTAKYDISYIKGVDDFSATTVDDSTAPVIELENDNDNFNIAVNEPFKLFDAKIIDYNFKGDLVKQVFYEYGTASQSQVSVINNYFTATKPGKYTILYTAKDSYGNTASRAVNLCALNTPNGKSIDYSVGEITTAEAGQEITLPTPNVTVFNNQPIIKAYAEFEDGEIINISSTSWKLFLKKVGEYKINYEFSDGIFTYTHSYVLTATASDKVYLEDIALPQYFIKEAGYTLDYARVVETKSKTLTYKEPTIYVSEDGAGFTKQVNRKNFSTTATSTVQFQYKLENTVVYTSEVIPVKDVAFKTKLDKTAYFDNVNLETSADNGGIILNTTAIGQDATTTFINPINFSNFSLTLDFAKMTIDAKRLEVILTDYTDADNQLVLTFVETSLGLRIIYKNYDIAFNKKNNTLSYNPSNGVLSDSFDNQLPIENPFTTDRFYLSFRLVGVTGASTIYLSNINSQPMNKTNYDTKGSFFHSEVINNRYSIGTIADVDFIYPDDALSPYLEENYFVDVMYYENEDSDGEYVSSLDGEVLDGTKVFKNSFSFNCEKIGAYQVTYFYKDQAWVNGKLNAHKSTETKIIYAADTTAPVITLNRGYLSSTVVLSYVGSTHKLVGYTVTDNCPGDIQVTAYVLTPNNIMSKLNGNSIKLSVRGDYHIYYYAVDASGNLSTATYIVRAL